MDEAEIYARMQEIVGDVFRRDDIRVHAALDAAGVEGWDSMKQIELVLLVEERFGLRFTSREIDALRNIGDFVALIRAGLR